MVIVVLGVKVVGQLPHLCRHLRLAELLAAAPRRRGNAPPLPDEIFFLIVQRKVVKPQDFDDLGVLADRLVAFQDPYNATADPFDWRFTRKSLDRLLERLAAHEKQAA